MGKRIAIVGGGYLGAELAKAMDDIADVTLIEPRSHFVHASAMIRAVVVLPVPRMPVMIKACAIRSAAKAFFSVRTIASWPTRSTNVSGRYFRART